MNPPGTQTAKWMCGPVVRPVRPTLPRAAFSSGMAKTVCQPRAIGPLRAIGKKTSGTRPPVPLGSWSTPVTVTSTGSPGLGVREASFVARRLRAAGAVLLGKANLSEWANFRSPRSSSGWSGRGRQCRSPYVLDRNPCGSSSGSGIAASASLVAAAIGTETNGSIVCPASANGIVGVKPTVGLVSRSCMGRAWSEPALLGLAHAFEQATHHRQVPRFLPTLALA